MDNQQIMDLLREILSKLGEEEAKAHLPKDDGSEEGGMPLAVMEKKEVMPLKDVPNKLEEELSNSEENETPDEEMSETPEEQKMEDEMGLEQHPDLAKKKKFLME